ncbi:MAG: hypothetical protein EOP85_17625 [Verrucomicrobiaceae bacterium]|nr:MAG: hypothetical protein EOP85_17625 [Verrucomicrobiaceae bacterium]
MQLTRFDRWLREKFVYETHIQTLREPETVPAGIRVVDVPDVPGKRYKHLFVASSSKVADQLIAQLRENSQMYTTQVVDKEAWYVPFIAPKDKSVTWWLFSFALISTSVFFGLIYVKGLVEDPEFRANFMEAIKLFKS